jgi:hypothetical protein
VLQQVVDYGDPAVDKLFAEGDAGKPLKHFAPNYPKSTDRSLSIVSKPCLLSQPSLCFYRLLGAA